MRTRTLVAGVAVLVAFVALAATTTAQGKEPWVGTWKLNLAKSTYSPGPPAKSLTVTITAPDGGIKQVVDTVPATGAALHYESTGKFDGKDVPIEGQPQRRHDRVQEDQRPLLRSDPEKGRQGRADRRS